MEFLPHTVSGAFSRTVPYIFGQEHSGSERLQDLRSCTGFERRETRDFRDGGDEWGLGEAWVCCQRHERKVLDKRVGLLCRPLARVPEWVLRRTSNRKREIEDRVA